ncbi:hypothetical protein HF668_03705 [Acidithiobacillus ferridurans]|uniref:hypothetical protein n=1 Tax=Acidithiobacillus ferridurans TaxID=1232575 RepID=UPI001C0669B0|nr:hypothetical protein [Acidithiobacillus ferridurans]MBU2804273.1 hypothetical protein [Acidithiobacillus ferridurans]
MSSDARLKTNILQHPKIKKLYRRFGAEGPLRFISLILWAASNRPDGNLSGMQNEDIELCVDWPLFVGEFVATLIDVGLLDGEPGNFVIHDWADHNPWADGESDRRDRAKFAALAKHYGTKYACDKMPDYVSKLQKKHAKEENKTCEEQPIVYALPDSAISMPVAESGKKKATPKPTVTPDVMCSMPGLSKQVAEDYLAHRRAKKAPLTFSAWKMICVEIAQSGATPDDALSEAMARGWTGFKSGWLMNSNQQPSGGENGKNSKTIRVRSLSAVEKVKIASSEWAAEEERKLRKVVGDVIDITPQNATVLDEDG